MNQAIRALVEAVAPKPLHRIRMRGPVDDEWGRSESLDPDDVGDIADEGMGHRG